MLKQIMACFERASLFRFETQTVEMTKRNETELNNQAKKMKELLKARDQLLEFKNTKMIRKKEIQNEENRYKMLLSLDN